MIRCLVALVVGVPVRHELDVDWPWHEQLMLCRDHIDMEEVARSGLENSVVAAFSQPVSVLPPQLLMPENGRPAPGGSSPRVRPHCEKGFEFYGWHEAS